MIKFALSKSIVYFCKDNLTTDEMGKPANIEKILKDGLKYLANVDAIPTIQDVAVACGVEYATIYDNRGKLGALYRRVDECKRLIVRQSYRDLMVQSANGNSQSSEKLIKVFGTPDERKAINGIIIEGEVELGLHEQAVNIFNELFGVENKE